MKKSAKNGSLFLNHVQSIELYRMPRPATMSRSVGQTWVGAILFGARRPESQVLRIVPPAPSLNELFQIITQMEASSLKERLIFHAWKRSEIVAAVESFCIHGLPLPNLFSPQFATLEGITEFQRSVYEFTSQIQHGDTRSYAWLSQQLRKRGSERAVGNALRANPFPLFIPCHRVLKKDGGLGGYCGTDLSHSWQILLKKTLLDLEKSHLQPSLFAYCGEQFLV